MHCLAQRALHQQSIGRNAHADVTANDLLEHNFAQVSGAVSLTDEINQRT
jgi:hypothetical protein